MRKSAEASSFGGYYVIMSCINKRYDLSLLIIFLENGLFSKNLLIFENFLKKVLTISLTSAIMYLDKRSACRKS